MGSIYKCVVLFLFLISVTHAKLYKTYRDDEICATKKHKIFLGKGQESGAIVQLTQQFPNSLHCNFTIEASKHSDGIYVVIQKLSLRRGSDGNCLDFIQFVTPKGFARRTCGEYQVGKIPLESVITTEDLLYVQISLYHETFLPGQNVEVTIAFTSYFNVCSRAGPNAQPCIPERNEGCIFGRYWGDKIVNCPSQDCLDEGGCEVFAELDDLSFIQPAPITLGAVTTVLLGLLLFMTCLWACRKHNICCWGPFCKDTHNTEDSRGTSAVLPTAPPIDIIHPPAFELHEPLDVTPAPGVTTPMAPNPDKDPPPSYESLFPD